MRRSPNRSFSAGERSMPTCVQSFTSWGSVTVARRPGTPSSTVSFDLGVPSVQEVTQLVQERVVMKLEALENRQCIKRPHVIRADHHHRKPFGQRAAQLLKGEESLHRLDDLKRGDRLAKEAERSRPLSHDVDEDALQVRGGG